MSVQLIVLRPDQYDPAVNVVGTQVTVLASNAARTMQFGQRILINLLQADLLSVIENTDVVHLLFNPDTLAN
jgi:hypothetical protein